MSVGVVSGTSVAFGRLSPPGCAATSSWRMSDSVLEYEPSPIEANRTSPVESMR